MISCNDSFVIVVVHAMSSRKQIHILLREGIVLTALT